MNSDKILEIIVKSAEYLEKTKPQYQNIHSYFVYINLTRKQYNDMLKLEQVDTRYEIAQKVIEVVERAKDIIISNIVQTQLLNPYGKNGNVAMQYLKIVSNEFKDETSFINDKVNIVLKTNTGPISLTSNKKDNGGK